MIGAFQAQISQKTMESCSSAASPSLWTPPLHVVEFEIELSCDAGGLGGPTFVKIPQHSQAGSTKFLIDGHVRPHTAAPCAPAFL